MSAIHATESKSVGLGRPSTLADADRPSTLTTSLSLSSSSSSSLNSLSPLPLARSQYSSAAHHFIQRRPREALAELEQARRLALQVISLDDEVRKSETWKALREKVVILWITLLVSFAKGEQSVTDMDTLLDDTNVILRSTDKAASFLDKLSRAVLVQWASTESDVAMIQSSAPGQDATRQRVLAALPASVTASLIMASLSIEEARDGAANSSGSTATSDASQQPSPNAVPLTRNLAEELLSAQSAHLDQGPDDAQQASSARSATLTAYGKVLELYSIHVLGVRCGQWDYADQLVRLSLLQDEPRAKLLLSLQRAHNHISTRPQRRASAALAQQQAYEAEKQRRASANAAEVKSRVDDAEAKADGGVKPSSLANGNGKKKEARTRYTSSSSNATSESESESSSSRTRTARPRQDKPIANANVSGNGGADFASTRAHLSQTIANHHQRDARSAASSSVDASSSSSSSATSRNANATTPQSTFKMLIMYLRTMKLRSSLPAVLSILAPLLVILFSVRRLTAGRRSVFGGSAAVTGSSASQRRNTTSANRPAQDSLLRRGIASVLGTLRMGTQVTYL